MYCILIINYIKISAQQTQTFKPRLYEASLTQLKIGLQIRLLLIKQLISCCDNKGLNKYLYSLLHEPVLIYIIPCALSIKFTVSSPTLFLFAPEAMFCCHSLSVKHKHHICTVTVQHLLESKQSQPDHYSYFFKQLTIP